MKKLSDTLIRSAKPASKPYKLKPWEDGPFVIVTPNGSKWWRFAYRFDGKQKLLSLGTNPVISLADARERRLGARKLLANGVNSGAHRKAEKAAGKVRASNSFEVIAREWFQKFSARCAESHSSKTIGRLERDVFPWIGDKPVDKAGDTKLRRATELVYLDAKNSDGVG